MSADTASEMTVIGHLLDDYVEWVKNDSDGEIVVDYVEAEDVFSVARHEGPRVAVFSSEIDHKFYHEATALFIEAEIGELADDFDLGVVMQFSGDELVLSRISLSERGDEDEGTARRVLVVEAALPNSKIEFSLLDLMVREVSTIANDLRTQLGFAEAVEEDEAEGFEAEADADEVEAEDDDGEDEDDDGEDIEEEDEEEED